MNEARVRDEALIPEFLQLAFLSQSIPGPGLPGQAQPGQIRSSFPRLTIIGICIKQTLKQTRDSRSLHTASKALHSTHTIDLLRAGPALRDHRIIWSLAWVLTRAFAARYSNSG